MVASVNNDDAEEIGSNAIANELFSLSPRHRETLLSRLDEMLRDEDPSICWRALTIMRDFAEKSNVDEAKEVVYKMLPALSQEEDDETPGIVASAIYRIAKRLTPGDQLDLALRVLTELDRDNYGITNIVPATLDELMPLIPADGYPKLVSELEARFETEGEWIGYGVMDVAEVFSRHMSGKDLVPIGLKIQDRLGDEEEAEKVAKIHSKILKKSEFPELVQLSLGLRDRLGALLASEDKNNKALILPVLDYIVGLSIPVRLAVLAKTLQDKGLSEMARPELAPFFASLPFRALRDMAESRRNSDLLAFSNFIDAGLPLEWHDVWKEYVNSADRALFLTSFRKMAAPFRWGQEIDVEDPPQLRLAYLALDNPNAHLDEPIPARELADLQMLT